MEAISIAPNLIEIGSFTPGRKYNLRTPRLSHLISFH